MRFATATTISILSAALLGCATFRPGAAVEVSRAALLAQSHNDSTDCLWYRGSDETYHYICRNQAFHTTVGSEGSYKIHVEELPLTKTFAVGQGEYPLLTPAILDATANKAGD